MFLRATTLADISTVDGRSISSQGFSGLSSNPLRPHLNWPRQPSSLQPQYWHLWQLALRKTFLLPYSTCRNRTLSNPLGPWDTQVIPISKVWPTWYSPTYNKVYQRVGLFWRVADTTGRRQGGRRKRFTFHGTLIRECPRHATMMISLYPEGSSVVLDGELILSPLTPACPPRLNHSWSMDLIQQSQFLVDEIAVPADDGRLIAEGIRNGTARAVSDGSYKDDYGTAAGCIAASEDDQDLLYLVNSVPGLAADQNSYRSSELAGVLGILHTLEALCRFHQVTEGTITIALDGQEALRQASLSSMVSPLQSGQSSFDLLQPIRILCNQLPCSITWKWVEGHQAEKGRRLDWWANQNRLVDLLAKTFWNSCQRNSIPNTPRPLHREHYFVTWDQVKLSKFHHQNMYSQLYGERTRQYWKEKTKFSTEHIEVIMWPEAYQALSRLPFGLQRFWLKFATGFIGTSQKLYTRGFQDHARCPRCGEDGEDNVHVLRCSETATLWKTHHLSLQSELRRLHTAPELARAILSSLDAWRLNTSPPIPSTNLWGEHDAVLLQHTLGWHNFAFGRWHTQWALAQSNYLKSQGSKLSPRRWTSALIKKLYLTAWDFWDHRNKVLHAPGGPRAQAEARQLDQAVQAEYVLGPPPGLSSLDHHLFHTPLPDLLSMNISYKRRWLQSACASRDLARVPRLPASHATLRRQQHLMQRWLRQSNPPQPNPP